MYIHIQVHTILYVEHLAILYSIYDSCTLALNSQDTTKVVGLLAHQPLYTETLLTFHDIMFHIYSTYTCIVNTYTICLICYLHR